MAKIIPSASKGWRQGVSSSAQKRATSGSSMIVGSSSNGQFLKQFFQAAKSTPVVMTGEFGRKCCVEDVERASTCDT
eukprot:scaffold8886_cov72-Skeletonema_dohrnii-CCMP3373.AAC.1